MIGLGHRQRLSCLLSDRTLNVIDLWNWHCAMMSHFNGAMAAAKRHFLIRAEINYLTLPATSLMRLRVANGQLTLPAIGLHRRCEGDAVRRTTRPACLRGVPTPPVPEGKR